MDVGRAEGAGGAQWATTDCVETCQISNQKCHKTEAAHKN